MFHMGTKLVLFQHYANNPEELNDRISGRRTPIVSKAGLRLGLGSQGTIAAESLCAATDQP